MWDKWLLRLWRARNRDVIVCKTSFYFYNDLQSLVFVYFYVYKVILILVSTSLTD